MNAIAHHALHTAVQTGALQIRGLNKAYRIEGKPLPVLHNINLDVRPGEFVSIVGASGCGKSTLLRSLGRLLKPKAGGVAFVLAAMGEQLDAILDVTVVYPSQKQQKIPGFWDLISGAVPKVIVDIRTRELDPALWQGDYENDPVFRQTVQNWVNQLWMEKDARIEALRAEG